MTPDDTPVPGDDAIARAARDGLRHLAGSHAPIRLNWMAVALRARRVRQRRLAAVVAACAIVLTTGGVAVAATGNTGDHMSIAGQGETPTTTTTTTEASTSTSASEQTTTTPSMPESAGSTPGTEASTTTTTPVPIATPGDLTGTITLASTILVAQQPTTVSVTLRNVSDHPITLTRSWDTWLGVYIDYFDSAGLEGDLETPLASGEERAFTATITPGAEVVGTTHLFLAYLRGVVMQVGANVDAPLEGVPTVAVTVIPPGWAPGAPLEPSQGTWKAEITADTTQGVAGDPLTLHVNLTNLDDAPHKTEGYGLLGVFCTGSNGDNGVFLDAATLAPGAEQSFTVEYTLGAYQVGRLKCSVGMAFVHDAAGVYPRDSVQSDVADITVLPAGSPTTTTTSTTSP